MNSVKISQLYIYPLKSAQGISLTEMPIVSTGPQHDREWMLVNERGQFISQRTHPQMSQLSTQLTEEHLVVSATDTSQLQIPKKRTTSQTLELTLFNKTTIGEKVGDQFDLWFSDFLNQKVHLVRSPKTPSRYTSGNHGPINEILFPDGYPFLLTNQATLDELNSRLDSPVTMMRFRPNIVISGLKANQEDSWSSFEINQIPFLSVKACSRCAIIDVDPKTGTKSKEVSRTLKTYRTKDGNILFGRNLTHRGQGKIHLNSVITKMQ